MKSSVVKNEEKWRKSCVTEGRKVVEIMSIKKYFRINLPYDHEEKEEEESSHQPHPHPLFLLLPLPTKFFPNHCN